VTGPATPDVTVIVPTYRRATLARTLQGIALQEPDFSFELIVVDNDGARSAEPVVADHAPAMRAPVRYLYEPRTGSSYARNTAIAAANGAVIAWCDDDAEPQPGWLAALVAPIRAGNAEGTGGRVVLDPDVDRPRWFDERGIGGYVTSFHLGDEERELTGREFVVTANAAHATSWLRRIGGFDTSLGTMAGVNFGGDDVRVARSLRAAGARLRYVPTAVVVHELPPERLHARYLLRRAWWVGRSDWVLDAAALQQRKYGGARVALSWYAAELKRRRREGISDPAVLFHALCDTARVSGSLVGAAQLARVSRQEGTNPAGTVDR
jgi:glycosyltransferase involved in cell wall biosynthesis